MRVILIVWFLIIGNYSFAQINIDTSELKKKLILTEKQNDDWFIKFEGNSKSDKLVLLTERLILDTNLVFQKQYFHSNLRKQDNLTNNGLTPSKTAGNKILLVVNNYIFSEDYYEPKLIKYLENTKHLINKIIIDDIKVLRGASAAALYGRMGSNGVIFLNSSDNKSIHLVNKLGRKLKRVAKSTRN